VVSYTVVVEADNPGRQLLPGMTANAEIVLEERQDVLRLPNTALRFRPADPEIAARGQAMAAETSGRGGAAAQGGEGRQRGERAAGGSQRGERGAGGGGQRGGRGVAQMTAALELTEAQQATARQAFQSAMASMPPGEGQGDRRAAMRRMRDQVIRELEPTFSERQRQLLTQMREGGGARAEVRQQAVVWVLRNNRPTPVQVEIGIADNGHTVLLGGLNEGDEVVIGGGPQVEEEQRPGGPLGGGGGRGTRVRGA
jgi:HlyD family secretion protein